MSQLTGANGRSLPINTATYTSFAIWLLAAVLMAGRVAAQQAPQCPFETAEAIAILEAQTQTLGTARSIVVDTGIRTDPGDVQDAIRSYLSHPQFAGSDAGNALVAYVSKGQAICVLYARIAHKRFVFDMILLPKTADQISALIEENLAAFHHSGPPAPRAPRPRPEVEGSQQRSAISLTQRLQNDTRQPGAVLQEIAAVLFPYGLFSQLELNARSLSIVPALNMGRVPFSALDLDGDGKPLIESTAINIEASLKSVLDQTLYAWTPGLLRPAVFGDPDATADPDWLLPRLPGADREARRVARLLGIQPVIGPDATKARFLRDTAASDYIHVAAHGLASAADPMDKSFLALSGERLTAREIQHLKLTGSPVVVLSACQTALGGPLEAGIIGVSRAFLLAGGINVISSLWNVDDHATSEIMFGFVQNLASTNPAEALRLAQLSARSKWPDPRIWSAFVVYGARVVSR